MITAPSSFKIWLDATRPRTLPAAAAPVFLASALALRDGTFHPLHAALALWIALALQIAANYANDLFDYQRGADTAARLGPARATASGWVSPSQMLAATIIAFALATLAGIYLTFIWGLPIIVIGVAAILAALAYTGGPFPYGYHALGDVFVFLFFGVVAVCGSYFVQAGTVTWTALLVSVAPGLLIVNVLVVNNTRDLPTDSQTGKRTLAVLIGRRGSQIEFALCLLGAYLVPLGLALSGLTGWSSLFTWFSIPLAWRLWQEFQTTEGRALNGTLARTARLSLVFSALFALGIAL
jgi:1,4-dihydroxy-2-naphthoate polyprenyltransferase